MGLSGLNNAKKVEVRRVYADANIVWDIREIDYLTSEVPIPAAAWLFGSALIGLEGIKRRKKIWGQTSNCIKVDIWPL